MTPGPGSPGTAPLRIEPMRGIADARIIGGWIYEQWARHEDEAVWLENRADLERSLDPAVPIPKFFVGWVDEERVGCASIVPHDLPTHPELSPWLANILVLPAWRRRGYGRELARTAMAHACQHASELYLYTFDQVDLYQNLGWTALDQSAYTGRNITLMHYRCAQGAACADQTES